MRELNEKVAALELDRLAKAERRVKMELGPRPAALGNRCPPAKPAFCSHCRGLRSVLPPRRQHRRRPAGVGGDGRRQRHRNRTYVTSSRLNGKSRPPRRIPRKLQRVRKRQQLTSDGSRHAIPRFVLCLAPSPSSSAAWDLYITAPLISSSPHPKSLGFRNARVISRTGFSLHSFPPPAGLLRSPACTVTSSRDTTAAATRQASAPD